MSSANDKLTHLPEHIAIIMDGNGRWAKQYAMPRVMGHRKGVKVVREVVSWCNDCGIKYLSLFAFSTENWNRPQTEVSSLMSLFLRSLKTEAKDLIEKGVQLRVIGNRERLPEELVQHINMVEEQTCHNNKLVLIVCVDYGGRWDICNAIKTLMAKSYEESVDIADLNEEMLANHLQVAEIPPPDLLIRTGGERRISNFYLWQLAYAELYFCDTYWPDFSEQDFQQALQEYQGRIRRFGSVE